MPRIKLTKPSFVNLTGQLPGKNFRGVNFTDGISDEIPLAVVDKIAAQIGGSLVSADGSVIGPAGSDYRRTTIIPTPSVPRSESTYPVDAASIMEKVMASQAAAKISEDNAAASAASAAQSAADAAASAGSKPE